MIIVYEFDVSIYINNAICICLLQIEYQIAGEMSKVGRGVKISEKQKY